MGNGDGTGVCAPLEQYAKETTPSVCIPDSSKMRELRMNAVARDCPDSVENNANQTSS